MNNMNPIVIQWERVAELWTKCKGEVLKLEPHEQREIFYCMQNNANYWTSMASLKNLSYLVTETQDLDEQHKICAAIDQLEETGYTDYFGELDKR